MPMLCTWDERLTLNAKEKIKENKEIKVKKNIKKMSA